MFRFVYILGFGSRLGSKNLFWERFNDCRENLFLIKYLKTQYVKKPFNYKKGIKKLVTLFFHDYQSFKVCTKIGFFRYFKHIISTRAPWFHGDGCFISAKLFSGYIGENADLYRSLPKYVQFITVIMSIISGSNAPYYQSAHG